MSKSYGIASDLRDKIVNKRKACENLSISSRRSSCSYETPLRPHDIPKTTSELLRRYGTSRMRIPSYKQDAVNLMAIVLKKPLKRTFLQLGQKSQKIVKNFKAYEKNSNFLLKIPPNPGQKIRNFFRCPNEKSLILNGFSVLFKVFNKVKARKVDLAFRRIDSVYKKKTGAEGVAGFLATVVNKTVKSSFKLIQLANFNRNSSDHSSKLFPIPPLNLEKQFFSPYFPQHLRRSAEKTPARVLYENSMNSSKRSNILTDRRSEKPQNPSTLPSSIYSDSENSVTERSELKNTSKKRIQSIQLKNIDNFFNFDSVLERKKPVSKKSFFSSQEKCFKNSSKSFKTFADNYELFALDKILKQYTEKVLIKGFYKWKFGIKQRRSQSKSFKHPKFPKKSLKALFSLLNKALISPAFSTMKSNLQSFKQLNKLLANLTKDAKYRQKICFNHWKTKSAQVYIMKLKTLSFIQNLDYIIYMRKSWALNTFKIIKKKSYI